MHEKTILGAPASSFGLQSLSFSSLKELSGSTPSSRLPILPTCVCKLGHSCSSDSALKKSSIASLKLTVKCEGDLAERGGGEVGSTSRKFEKPSGLK